MTLKKYVEKFKAYHFEFKHLSVLFFFLLFFQIVVSLINKSSITSFLSDTKAWYQKDAVEKIANLTATSLELTLESYNRGDKLSEKEKTRIVQSLNIIFSQQILQHNIEELCIFAQRGDSVLELIDGGQLFAFVNNEKITPADVKGPGTPARLLYKKFSDRIKDDEQIISIADSLNNLHVFVPFVIKGEQLGTVYMKNSPNFSSLSDELFASQNESTIMYISLILLGFVSMYFISSYSVRERDEAQKKLLLEHEENLKKQFNYEKEMAFTKRIYHAHHKAEKVMGFIKEDLNKLSAENINSISRRIIKYSNFVSRVIYDMKWFDPPVQTIRGPIYNTDLNEVLEFIVNNIFLRVSAISESFKFNFEFDQNLPKVHVNEFVIWELFEPLIQNAVEHGGSDNLNILIKTSYDQTKNISRVYICDNGKGIEDNLLRKSKSGIENIFLENISTKSNVGLRSGYGCYIAYQIAGRCGWNLSVKNNPEKGTTFVITIKN
jgi:anti-sigma regulatory factor (Ser/Thr protein kinase)